ncbi:hypothetical protein TOK_5603 [Pseudonocardia sp. N23]|nr:hypothetical protein TOK_5603 [Pseudonocardia sp. N23]
MAARSHAASVRRGRFRPMFTPANAPEKAERAQRPHPARHGTHRSRRSTSCTGGRTPTKGCAIRSRGCGSVATHGVVPDRRLSDSRQVTERPLPPRTPTTPGCTPTGDAPCARGVPCPPGVHGSRTRSPWPTEGRRSAGCRVLGRPEGQSLLARPAPRPQRPRDDGPPRHRRGGEADPLALAR